MYTTVRRKGSRRPRKIQEFLDLGDSCGKLLWMNFPSSLIRCVGTCQLWVHVLTLLSMMRSLRSFSGATVPDISSSPALQALLRFPDTGGKQQMMTQSLVESAMISPISPIGVSQLTSISYLKPPGRFSFLHDRHIRDFVSPLVG